MNVTIGAHGAEVLRIPGVVSIRPGYHVENGWITSQPAIVVTVRPQTLGEESPTSQLPAKIDDVWIDVTSAVSIRRQTGTARLGKELVEPETSWGHESADDWGLPGEEVVASGEEAPSPVPQAGLELPTLEYQPPPGIPLAETIDSMTLTAHVSPDAGWPTLRGFLDGVKNQLTVAMYDFTAPQILDEIIAAVSGTGGKLCLILDPRLALGSAHDPANPKAHDVTEDVVRARLTAALGGQLSFEWAAVREMGKTTAGIFPSAYHIKVAVRDSGSFWLSSGNWQSSNQPNLDPLGSDAGQPDILQTYNREWHVILDHPGLASLYEQYISWDMQQAKPLQEGTESVQLPSTLAPAPSALEAMPAARAAPKYFAPLVKTFPTDRPLRVQPLLTPDNYAELILPLIRSAKTKLYFQNQYIHIGKQNPDGFKALIGALRDQQQSGVDVRIILRDIGQTRLMLEALQFFGFQMAGVKLQPQCHNKGIVVDSQVAVVGSHNWSAQGTLRNRDASLIIYDGEVAQYFEQVFLYYDWDNLAHQKIAPGEAVSLVARDGAPVPQATPALPWDAFYED